MRSTYNKAQGIFFINLAIKYLNIFRDPMTRTLCSLFFRVQMKWPSVALLLSIIKVCYLLKDDYDYMFLNKCFSIHQFTFTIRDKWILCFAPLYEKVVYGAVPRSNGRDYKTSAFVGRI